MDECQKYAEQYSTAVKVRRPVPCLRFHVQIFREVLLWCTFKAFAGHSICVKKWNRDSSLFVTYLLILYESVSHVTTPVSFILSLCHTRAQPGHTPMCTRIKCSSVIRLLPLCFPPPLLAGVFHESIAGIFHGRTSTLCSKSPTTPQLHPSGSAVPFPN